jgi:hypothetical protein
MTTDTQIQVIPAAIFNGTITKLEKRIAASWGQLERAVQSKDITAARAGLSRVAHLEDLRQRHVALEQRIAQTISNASPTQIAPVLEVRANVSPTQAAPFSETRSNGLPSQPAPVLESPNRLSSHTTAVPETVFSGPISQIAPVLQSLSSGLSTQSAPVPETMPNVSLSQNGAAPVLQSSNGSSNQTAPVPETISNGSSTQTAPVVESIPNGSPSQTAPVPQPEAQTPVARPKKKPVRPVEMKFGSVKKHIRYATEIPVAIANWLIEQGKELPITANFIHPSEAGFSHSATTKKLKSGQFMRVGHNQEALLHKARELLDGCGYEGVQIKVLLDNGITLSA